MDIENKVFKANKKLCESINKIGITATYKKLDSEIQKKISLSAFSKSIQRFLASTAPKRKKERKDKLQLTVSENDYLLYNILDILNKNKKEGSEDITFNSLFDGSKIEIKDNIEWQLLDNISQQLENITEQLDEAVSDKRKRIDYIVLSQQFEYMTCLLYYNFCNNYSRSYFGSNILNQEFASIFTYQEKEYKKYHKEELFYKFINILKNSDTLYNPMLSRILKQWNVQSAELIIAYILIDAIAKILTNSLATSNKIFSKELKESVMTFKLAFNKNIFTAIENKNAHEVSLLSFNTLLKNIKSTLKTTIELINPRLLDKTSNETDLFSKINQDTEDKISTLIDTFLCDLVTFVHDNYVNFNMLSKQRVNFNNDIKEYINNNTYYKLLDFFNIVSLNKFWFCFTSVWISNFQSILDKCVSIKKLCIANGADI